MAVLTTQTVTALAGTAVTMASAAAGGDTVNRPARGLYLKVTNGSGGSLDVTIAVPGNAWNGAAAPDTTVAVAAGATKYIPMDARYANSSNQAAITYSGVTSLTVAAIQF